MSGKQYVEQIRLINIRIQTLSEQIECLRSAAEYTSPKFSEAPASATRNVHRMEDTIIRIMEWQDKIKAEYDKLDAINETISTLSNPIAQAILVRRYVKGETWDVIMRSLYISRRRLFEIHAAALDEIEKTALREPINTAETSCFISKEVV